jgi:hypothetical protein
MPRNDARNYNKLCAVTLGVKWMFDSPQPTGLGVSPICADFEFSSTGCINLRTAFFNYRSTL